MIDIRLGEVQVQLDLMTVLVWVLVGLIAGFLASRVMLGHGMGVLADIVVGILGAILGGFLADAFGIQVNVTGAPIVGTILIAFFGALILLLLFRLVSFARRRRRIV